MVLSKYFCNATYRVGRSGMKPISNVCCTFAIISFILYGADSSAVRPIICHNCHSLYYLLRQDCLKHNSPDADALGCLSFLSVYKYCKDNYLILEETKSLLRCSSIHTNNVFRRLDTAKL